MGRQSRKHRERQANRAPNEHACPSGANAEQASRIMKLQDEINDITDGDAVFQTSPNCPVDAYESELEDIRAFEAVGSGVSLFVGLQTHGLELPRPEQLDERQSAEKSNEVMKSLADLRIYLVGFENMTAREFYSTLYHQTLWEGCYVKKRNPCAVTMIDVSHRMSKSKMRQFLDNLLKRETVH
jgi:hypothetical protein